MGRRSSVKIGCLPEKLYKVKEIPQEMKDLSNRIIGGLDP